MPRIRPDAIVVLCGEDADERLNYAFGLFSRDRGQCIVLSGGVDGHGKKSAETLKPKLYGCGLSPSKIFVESQSTNTREQAVNVVALAIGQGWKCLHIVASHYHLPRAFLTFLKALQEVDKDEEIRLVGVSVDTVPWWGTPEGSQYKRIELLSGEAGKIAMYPEHVCSYSEGLMHLRLWEGV
jgi:uncharacterized SAM-binding protein YcdF (DUF218 family)